MTSRFWTSDLSASSDDESALGGSCGIEGACVPIPAPIEPTPYRYELLLLLLAPPMLPYNDPPPPMPADGGSEDDDAAAAEIVYAMLARHAVWYGPPAVLVA